MDLKQLRYFLSIVESGSITRAAETLCIAQPALSLHIKNLEEELGVRLFSRSVQGVKVTPSGELLYRHAKGLVRQADNTKLLLSQHARQPNGTVVVGMPHSTAHLIAIDVVQELRAHYPGIILELTESSSSELYGLVLLGRVDLAVVVLDQPVRGLTRTPLLNEQLFLIRHPDMAGIGATCSLAELARLPLVLISPPNIVRTKLDRAFAAAQLDYNLVAVVNSTSMLVSWVERGVGATVLPWSAVHEQVASGRLIATPLDGDEWQRDLWLCHAETLPLTPAGEIVQGLIIQDVQRRLLPGAWLGARSLAALDET
ncbi:HTH-type transcriptional regulator CatM [Caballeronia sp. SBC1]|uniref:LysR family transcriptional regulator n=1 Tax=unclassified Caballeronia TaxID=2646786 RepID=UPI0013E19B43|nr:MULTISPECIES: LysR substrate-binding domain-containing protein [unclassified Caballeronia]QIE23975.1 HTH-type transcriptional regulator CatM [Caballeronia sp. SBC2]QIN61871.1 HTH-type transcriptional regulator CatM [Caballeronia sp. SBC1]